LKTEVEDNLQEQTSNLDWCAFFAHS